MDEHLFRVVRRLLDQRQQVHAGTASPASLLAASRTAEHAVDHAHPDWLNMLEGLTLRLDAVLHPWPPPRPGDERREEVLEASEGFAAAAELLLTDER